MIKKMLILGAGEMQLPIIQKATELGVYTIVADMNAKAPGFQYANEKLLISTLDYDSLLKYSRENCVDGILTTSDYPVNIVAAISDELGLPAMSKEVAKICTDKYLQRSLFLQKGIATPHFKLCDSIPEELCSFNEYPYVIKPVDSSASRGVQKVCNAEQLTIAFQQAFSYSKSGRVLIESFIEGREFSVETYTQGGKTTIIAVTEKMIIGEECGYFVEDTHIEPARISDDEYQLIEKEVLKAIAIIGLDNCPSHTEVKLNSKGVYIIEIACRLGGDYITSDLVPLSTGVDMLGNLIKVSLGEQIDIKKKISNISCIQFLNADNYNRCLKYIASEDKYMRRYEIKPYSGSTIKSSLDRLGYIILQTNTMVELEEILLKIK